MADRSHYTSTVLVHYDVEADSDQEAALLMRRVGQALWLSETMNLRTTYGEATCTAIDSQDVVCAPEGKEPHG